MLLADFGVLADREQVPLRRLLSNFEDASTDPKLIMRLVPCPLARSAADPPSRPALCVLPSCACGSSKPVSAIVRALARWCRLRPVRVRSASLKHNAMESRFVWLGPKYLAPTYADVAWTVASMRAHLEGRMQKSAGRSNLFLLARTHRCPARRRGKESRPEVPVNSSVLRPAL